MIARRLALGVGLLSLFGCARPALPPADAVQPAAPEPEVTEPEPTTPAEPVEPAESAEVRVEGSTALGGMVRPDDGSAYLAGETVTVALEPGPEYLLFVDAEPPQVVAEGELSVKLTGLAAGPHLLRAVPLQDGVPQLGDGAVSTRTIQIGATPDGVPAFAPNGPIVTVGRPFGSSRADERGEVQFDVRVDHALISPTGAQVKWTVDGQPGGSLSELPAREPLFLGPLTAGQHTLEVWLENGDGTTPTNGGLERVKRTFTIEAKPLQSGPII